MTSKKTQTVMYRFSKRGFRERQSATLKNNKKRYAVMIDVNLQSNGKILLLHEQKDFTLLGLYFQIISNLDLETEEWTIRSDELKKWAMRTFGVNNKYDLYARLSYLSEIGLFDFEVLSDQLVVNNMQSNHEQDQTYSKPKDNFDTTLVIDTQIETPETLAALRATKNNTIQTIQTKHGAQEVSNKLDAATEIFLEKSKAAAHNVAANSATNQNISFVAGFLLNTYTVNKPANRTPEQIHASWSKALEKWDRGQPYFIKVFQGLLVEDIEPTKQPFQQQQTQSAGIEPPWMAEQRKIAKLRSAIRWDSKYYPGHSINPSEDVELSGLDKMRFNKTLVDGHYCKGNTVSMGEWIVVYGDAPNV